MINFINMSAEDKFDGKDGEVFLDGCCFNPTTPPLARAGFAAVQMGRDGTIHKAVYGCVPSAFPQTSLAGEYSSLTAAYELGQGIDVVVDCADLVRSFHLGIPRALYSGPHACSWKFILRRNPDWGSCVRNVFKVKAHRALADVGDGPSDFARWLGNSEADRLAKLGAELHATDEDDIDNYKSTKAKLLKLANYMVNNLYNCLNDPAEKRRKVPLLKLGVTPILDKRENNHSFIWQNKMWICTYCFLKTSCPVSSSAARSKCVGISSLDAVLRQPKGHKLCSACIHGGGIILFCSRCWAYCTTKPNKLKEQCAGLGGPYANTAKRFILSNRYPATDRVLYNRQKVN